MDRFVKANPDDIVLNDSFIKAAIEGYRLKTAITGPIYVDGKL